MLQTQANQLETMQTRTKEGQLYWHYFNGHWTYATYLQALRELREERSKAQ